MTKYSLESMKDDDEPEEGEIQDDDDQIEEVPLKTVGTSTKGTDRETYSKSFLLCPRNESKSCSRKSNFNAYGEKPYYTSGTSDDAVKSNHSSSRTRHRTSPAHKWYHTHRQSSSSSKEWGVSKTSMGPKEREKRDSKRTSRNQYYSSFSPSPCDQRSVPNMTPGNSYLNISIPPWRWYSKHNKDKNKKSGTSPTKTTSAVRQSSASNSSQFNDFRISLNSEKNIAARDYKRNNLEKNYSCPGSPASTNSVEIIEVPPKIPEIITIYDSDEEFIKDSSETSSKNKVSSPREDKVAMDNQSNPSTSEMPQESCFLKDILQGSSDVSASSRIVQEHAVQKNNEDVQKHLKELAAAMRNMYDEKRKQELNLQQNMQEANLSFGESPTLAQRENEENNLLVCHVNKECAIPEKDTQVNILSNNNECMLNKSTVQAELDNSEKSVNNEENSNVYLEINTEENACLYAQTAFKSTSIISDDLHQNMRLSPTVSCRTNEVLHSPCCLSSPAGYMIGDDLCSIFMSGSSPSQAQIYSASTEELDDSQTIESSATLSKDESTVQHIQNSIYSPSIFQTDEVATIPNSEIHLLQNSNCSCQKNMNICDIRELGYKCHSYTHSSLKVNRTINYSNLKLIIPTNEKINSSNGHKVLENEIRNNHSNDKDEGNSLNKKNPCTPKDNEKNCSISNLSVTLEGDEEEKSSGICQKVANVPLDNIVQTEYSRASVREEMDKAKPNTTSRNAYAEQEITGDESINDLSAQENTLTKNIQNEENNDLINGTENEKNILWKGNTLTKSVESVQASTVAALKRRATELKKLQHHESETVNSTAKRSENQILFPSVVHKQLRETAFSISSPPRTSSRQIHENEGKIAPVAVQHGTTKGSISENAIDSLSEKCHAYTSPPLVYEDRIGTNVDRENGHFKEQIRNRINVTVPELIINLGKESDSGDDSDDKSSRSKTADENTLELKAKQKSKISTSRPISTDFEKKLEVLLKQARSQQESSVKYNKGSIDPNEQLATSSVHLNRQNGIFAPVRTTYLPKNIQSPSGAQGCARAIPRSTVKKMACSRAGKNHRIKSVVIKNSYGTVNHDRTAIKHSTSVTNNSYRQTSKGWNRNAGIRGKFTRQTSSMGDIGLLPPLKQKEYMKLKRQLVQMTQRKRDIRNKERIESDRSSKPEESKLKQTVENTTNMRNNSQEVTAHSLTFEEENLLLSKAEQVTKQKAFQIATGNKPTEIHINTAKHGHRNSDDHSCCTRIEDVNIINKAENVWLGHNHIPGTNVSEVITRSKLPQINNFQEPSLTDSHENENAVPQHHREFSPTSQEGQTTSILSNYDDPKTIPHGEDILSGKRKLTISASEQVQKKQKTVSDESEKPSELYDTAIKETVRKNSDQSKLVENLWSSETKLIARRRQVLEDIATVRLQLHKIEATNFRKDLLLKNVYRLKDELKQAEEKLRQEEECVKSLTNMIDSSRSIIQRDQSELLSLSLECEELGCKVHGAPNYNVPKTCVDLIRNEMLAMTEAMQELENQKNAMYY